MHYIYIWHNKSVLNGFQARIQEFSSEGVQLSENLAKQKKKKKKKKKNGGQKTEEKTEGCSVSSLSADVIDFPDNYLHTSFFGRAWSFVQLQAPLCTSTKMTW